MKYRKKPVVIEAMRFMGPFSIEEMSAEWGSAFDVQCKMGKVDLLIATNHQGVQHARAGDWVIRGIAGEFYPCTDEVFRATYEAAT